MSRYLCELFSNFDLEVVESSGQTFLKPDFDHFLPEVKVLLVISQEQGRISEKAQHNFFG